ncbi:MAG: hypothetical protein IT178_12170 [Acidobacteria bacterium]|nr:hypothetical protein [Acidobacteriota bacterium]
MMLRTTLVMAALALPLAPASAQTVDPRWAPYLGCWQLQRETSGDAVTDLISAAARALPPDQKQQDVMICVTPSEKAGAVSQQTVVDNRTVNDETVAGDGSVSTAEEASCTSTRRAEWSTSGRLLYSTGSVACAGQPERKITGLSYVGAGPTWVDIQAVDVRDRRQVRVRRYMLSREQRQAGRRAAGIDSPPLFNRWTLDEMKEASRKTSPEALQAALVETGSKLPLNARTLRELAAADVDDSVIDVMMALSFPEKFVIERATTSLGSAGPGGYPPVGPGFGSPLGWTDPWLMASPWGFMSMYSPFAYQYYGYYDPRFGPPGWGWAVVNPNPGGGGSSEPQVEGRVVNGAGYTRVRPREPEPARVNAGGGTVDRSGSGGSRDGGNSGGSGGSGGGVTTGGYSGGSSGGSSSGGSSGGGRTAVPRPPGGGGH